VVVIEINQRGVQPGIDTAIDGGQLSRTA